MEHISQKSYDKYSDKDNDHYKELMEQVVLELEIWLNSFTLFVYSLEDLDFKPFQVYEFTKSHVADRTQNNLKIPWNLQVP